MMPPARQKGESMTITRSDLQRLRDNCRKDAKGHFGDIDRHLNKLATELDGMDAVMARDQIHTIWESGYATDDSNREVNK